MKKFLKHIGIFLSLLLVFATVTDYMVSRGLRKTDIRMFAAWNDIYNGTNLNNDLVVLGASCAWCEYNTYIMDSLLQIGTYNLGIDGHTFSMQKIRYETYARFAPAPKFMIINIDIGTFGVLNTPYEREQFFPYIFDAPLIKAVKESKELSVMDRFCPFWRYIGYKDILESGLCSFFGKQQFFDGGMHKGYRGNDYQWNPESVGREEKIYIGIDDETLSEFQQFIADRQSEGITIILCKNPIYKRLQNNLINKNVFDSTLNSISNSYQIPLLDFWDMDIVQDSSFFYNPSHLNTLGSSVYTQEFCKKIIDLKLIKGE